MNTIDRFSSKAEKYHQYRWQFSKSAIEHICKIAKLSSESTVADIGAGTGMLAQHFINRVQQVFAIEPNLVMRELAIKQLGNYAGLTFIDALSEHTTLSDQSVDLITVGRAIHWFQPKATKREFLRILKPQGWLAILQVPCLHQEIVNAIKTIKNAENGWEIIGDRYKSNQIPLSFYYGGEPAYHFYFSSTVTESWHEFRGRLLSLSVTPSEEHPLYANFEQAAKKIFDTFSDGDRLILPIATEVYLGQISHGSSS